jgi:hypothetical protein
LTYHNKKHEFSPLWAKQKNDGRPITAHRQNNPKKPYTKLGFFLKVVKGEPKTLTFDSARSALKN